MSSAAREVADEAAFTVPYRHPYHLGLYVAVNAIPDAYAIIDGPDCLYRKAEWVHGSHDLRSTLLDVLGHHRVVPTLMAADGVIRSTGDELVKRVRKVAQIPNVGLGLICSMPHVTIIGTQYDRLLASLSPELRFPLVEVPSRSLEGDWLTGFSETLAAIARHLDVRGARPAPDRVAVIGYLMDRTEHDHQANVAQIERMFGALGLEVASVWVSDRPYAHLEQARHAGTLIALPHGRAAALALARRTGARVIEIPVPFGPVRTQRALRAVAAALGKEALAERFIEAELSRLAPRLEWAVPHVFLARRAVFSGDPAMFGGFLQIAEELGMEVLHLSTPARRPEGMEDLELELGATPPMLFAPPSGELSRAVTPLFERDEVDVVVASSDFEMNVQMWPDHVPLFEFGFPSQRRHALFERPYLGFEGWIAFVDDLARVLLEARGRRQPAPDRPNGGGSRRIGS